MAVFHTALGFIALVSGLPVFFSRKGTSFHKAWGKVYAAAMYLLCGSSFFLSETTPFTQGWDVFHVMALVSLVSVTGGLACLLLRGRAEGWYEGHLKFMLWSYIGLVMATGSHLMQPVLLFFRQMGLPGTPSLALTAALLWGVPPLVGSLWIRRTMPKYHRLFGAAPAPIRPDAAPPDPRAVHEA